ncbi:MAG: hypothetical protein WC606_01935 [Candidatus Absconditabacterales bacterium]|jgi:hypothetical protein
MKKSKKFPKLAETLEIIKCQIISKKKVVSELERQLSKQIAAKEDTSNTIKALRDAVSDKVAFSRNFRHHHIAYCELRGRTRNQIENTVRITTTKVVEDAISQLKLLFDTAK